MLTEQNLPLPDQFETFHPFIRGVFSQWHATHFQMDGVAYVTAEQWMMHQKARLFGDDERASKILATPHPEDQKRLGASVIGFDQIAWDQSKIDIVYRGNLAKFSQNAGAKRQLMNTAPSMLVEANSRDSIWGIGRSIEDPRVHIPAEWNGLNLLGRILTRVRSSFEASS